MPLSPEQVKQLLAKPEPTRTSKGKAIDTKNRTPEIWFKLNHKLFDDELERTSKCSNPECVDPRGGDSAVVANVNGSDMCRYCFLDGWLLTIEGQETLDE